MGRKYVPVHEHIIVRRDHEEEMSPSGNLYIPEQNRDKPQEGEVLAVGSGYRTPQGITPLEVKEGDRVVFGRYSGNDVKMGGEMVVILKEEELLATFTFTGEDEPIQEPTPVIAKKTGDERLSLMATLGAKYRAEGYSLPSTTASLRQDNEEQCDPPLFEEEISKLAEAIFAE
jgi:chaperonin GroES